MGGKDKIHQGVKIPSNYTKLIQYQRPSCSLQESTKGNETVHVMWEHPTEIVATSPPESFFFPPVNNHQNHVIQEDNDYHVCQEGKQRLATQSTPVHYNP